LEGVWLNPLTRCWIKFPLIIIWDPKARGFPNWFKEGLFLLGILNDIGKEKFQSLGKKLK